MSEKVSISFDTERSLIRCSYHGDVDYSDILDSCRRRYSLSQFSVARYCLVDYSDTSIEGVTPEEMMEIVQASVEASKVNSLLIMVAVMPSELQFGMARMWQGFATDLPWKSHIFRSLCEAYRFIDEREAER